MVDGHAPGLTDKQLNAYVGAGVTSLLFFLTLKKIHAIDARNEVRRAHAQEKQNEQNGGADNGNA